jgi:hypothetical protein
VAYTCCGGSALLTGFATSSDSFTLPWMRSDSSGGSCRPSQTPKSELCYLPGSRSCRAGWPRSRATKSKRIVSSQVAFTFDVARVFAGPGEADASKCAMPCWTHRNVTHRCAA